MRIKSAVLLTYDMKAVEQIIDSLAIHFVKRKVNMINFNNLSNHKQNTNQIQVENNKIPVLNDKITHSQLLFDE